MKAAFVFALVILACAVVSTMGACSASKFFKGSCNPNSQDCQYHCTNIENAKGGNCVYRFPAFKCECCF